MSIILGIESTAHTFGVAVVSNGKVLSNCKRVFTTEEGGMIPLDVAKFHFNNKTEIYSEALDLARANDLTPKGVPRNFSLEKFTRGIDAIAFSQGPGLAPCLLEGLKFVKELSEKLKKPVVPVNHCIAHLEIGRLTGARDPVMLYASGANTQIIAYASGKYRIFGETLDIGVGNFIDTFGRYAGIGFPAGPAIQKLASTSEKYIELPYKVKGMDIALSGILTNLRQKLENIEGFSPALPPKKKVINKENSIIPKIQQTSDLLLTNSKKFRRTERGDKSLVNYTLSDLAYSLQETVFAMLVETAERALAHTGKKELLLGGGVACNTRLQEMCKIMCEERGAKFFCPENQFLVDNAGMIAYLGEIIFEFLSSSRPPARKKADKIKSKFIFYPEELNKLDIHPRERTDDVIVNWRN